VCDDTPAARALQEAIAGAQSNAAPPLPPQLWHPSAVADERLEGLAAERAALAEAFQLLCSQAAPGSTPAGGAAAGAAADGGTRDGAGGAAGEAAVAGVTVLTVASCQRAAVLLHALLGLGQEGVFAVAPQPAGISCVDLAPGAGGDCFADATVHCINSRTHLGEGRAGGGGGR